MGVLGTPALCEVGVLNRERLVTSSDQNSLRLSTKEREDVLQQLQIAFADGRISNSEFDSRMTLAVQAKTRGDIAQLTADLPVIISAERAKIVEIRQAAVSQVLPY